MGVGACVSACVRVRVCACACVCVHCMTTKVAVFSDLGPFWLLLVHRLLSLSFDPWLEPIWWINFKPTGPD